MNRGRAPAHASHAVPGTAVERRLRGRVPRTWPCRRRQGSAIFQTQRLGNLARHRTGGKFSPADACRWQRAGVQIYQHDPRSLTVQSRHNRQVPGPMRKADTYRRLVLDIHDQHVGRDSRAATSAAQERVPAADARELHWQRSSPAACSAASSNPRRRRDCPRWIPALFRCALWQRRCVHPVAPPARACPPQSASQRPGVGGPNPAARRGFTERARSTHDGRGIKAGASGRERRSCRRGRGIALIPQAVGGGASHPLGACCRSAAGAYCVPCRRDR